MIPVRALSLAFFGCSVAASLSACHVDTTPRPHRFAARAPEPERIDRLDCPERVGALNRVKLAADGRSCQYDGPDGAEVTLRLVDLDDGTAEAALEPLEAELKAQLPLQTSDSEPEIASDDAGARDGVNIDIPGVRIDANDEGANIRLGRINVNAGDEDADIHVDRPADRDAETAQREAEDDSREVVVRRAGSKGDVSIDANARGAEIRVSAPGRGVGITYILASNTPGPNGYRVVGYEARGPSGGPIVVASVRSTGERRNVFEPMKRLVARNTRN